MLRVQGSPFNGRDERGSQASTPASQPTGLAKDNTDMTAELQVGSVLHRVESGCILVSLKIPSLPHNSLTYTITYPLVCSFI